MLDATAKDVVLAIFGASAGLGGLVLVFLGLVIAGYQSLPPATPKAVKDRAKLAGWPVAGVFSLSMASVGLSLGWLAAPGGVFLYHLAIWVFAAELIAVFALAIGMTWKMLS